MIGAGIIIAIIVYAIILVRSEYDKYKKGTFHNISISTSSPKWKEAHLLLSQHFVYYQKLSKEQKDEFVGRCLRFIKVVQWLSGTAEPVSQHKKILIAASAIQLTFGLPFFHFSKFKSILVFEDAYYNSFTKAYHKGEVSGNGKIVLSWKYFKEGYATADDKINLGLHEMAHALDLSIVVSQGRSSQIGRLMDHFRQSAFNEFIALRNRQSNNLRGYGGTNLREFFSVAVEHFFEAPADFNAKMPDLYTDLCRLLNQDPLNGIARGYKHSHQNLFSNTIQPTARQHMKPLFVISPNIQIAVPLLFTLGLLSFLLFTLHIANYPPIAFQIGYLAIITLLLLQANLRGCKAIIYSDYFVFRNWLLPVGEKTIHVKNVLHVNFTNMLTHYEMHVVYFDKAEIKEYNRRLYCSSAKTKQLEKMLLTNNVAVKHNSKRLKKTA